MVWATRAKRYLPEPTDDDSIGPPPIKRRCVRSRHPQRDLAAPTGAIPPAQPGPSPTSRRIRHSASTSCAKAISTHVRVHSSDHSSVPSLCNSSATTSDHGVMSHRNIHHNSPRSACPTHESDKDAPCSSWIAMQANAYGTCCEQHPSTQLRRVSHGVINKEAKDQHKTEQFTHNDLIAHNEQFILDNRCGHDTSATRSTSTFSRNSRHPSLSPLPPCTPPEHVYEALVDPDFEDKLKRAFEASGYRDIARRYKYGAEVAEVWKRGSTPDDARERWAANAAARRAAADVYTPE